MIVPAPYREQTIGVFGLARTGRAAVAALHAAGARVLAWDDAPQRRADLPVGPVDLYAADFADLDGLVLAPGVPLTHPRPHPLAEKARDAGTPMLSDIDLFAAARSGLAGHDVIAITGTNGKSSSAALMAHVLRACGRPAALGGNIGVPVLELEPLAAGGAYVFELSSFQLELTRSLDCEVAVLLNITPDHLDRHGNFANYVAAKRRLFEIQSPAHTAVVGVDDVPGREIAESLDQPVVPVSVDGPVDGGIYVDAAGRLVDAVAGPAEAVADLAGLTRLAGRHNWQNAAAVYAAGRVLGLAGGDIVAALADFPGLAHRCEQIAETGGVRVVNDSKATNLEAAATALAAFDSIRWIAGGRAKRTDLGELSPYFERIRRAYLVGEAAPAFAAALDGRVATRDCGDLDSAVEAALAEAEPGDVVLFSPGCASFDQFADFEARGEAFRAAVRKRLPGGAA